MRRGGDQLFGTWFSDLYGHPKTGTGSRAWRIPVRAKEPAPDMAFRGVNRKASFCKFWEEPASRSAMNAAISTSMPPLSSDLRLARRNWRESKPGTEETQTAADASGTAADKTEQQTCLLPLGIE